MKLLKLLLLSSFAFIAQNSFAAENEQQIKDEIEQNQRAIEGLRGSLEFLEDSEKAATQNAITDLTKRNIELTKSLLQARRNALK